MKYIIGGFKVTGIYPFNPLAVLPKFFSQILPHFLPDLSSHIGLKFIPLFSPLPRRYNLKIVEKWKKIEILFSLQ